MVPNKTLITGDLTNWSLTDATVRIVVPVGVAYGSDTEAAHRIMLETAQSLPTVLETPAPTVYFSGLGESSLDFQVRMFVPNISDMFVTRHRYLMEVEKRLGEAEITIPFPQRDLHIRSSNVQFVPGQSAGGPETPDAGFSGPGLPDGAPKDR